MTYEKSKSAVAQFMTSPLMIWFASCLDDLIKHKVTFDEVVDGVLIYNVFLKMDIHGQINDVAPSEGDHEQRLKNLRVIMANMRLFYEEDCVLLKEPELRLIATAADDNIREVELLLVLLLGCAVKCPNKRSFIERITKFDDEIKTVIKSHLEKVTEFPDIVLCRDMLLVESEVVDEEPELEQQSSHTQKVYRAFEEIRRINKERIELIEREETTKSASIPQCMTELKEWKSKALQLKHIEEECMEQLTKYAERLEILESDNLRLAGEAKAAKEYRDELDATMEKAIQAEHLEREVKRYREKLEQHESCKSRLEEMKQDNKLLTDNKDELVMQLNVCQEKISKASAMEEQMYKMQKECDRLALENAAFKKNIIKLHDINDELERKVQFAEQASGPVRGSSITSSNESLASVDHTIHEQMSQSSTSRALKLELENRRLCQLLESLRDNASQDAHSKLSELQTEKRYLEEANADLRDKMAELERALATNDKEKMRLRVSLEKALKSDKSDKSDKSGEGAVGLRLAALEFEKREALRELERTQMMLKEKVMSLDTSSKIIQELETKLRSLKRQIKRRNERASADNEDAKAASTQAVLYERMKNDFNSLLQERDALRDKVRESHHELGRQTELVKRLESTLKQLEASADSKGFEYKYKVLKSNFAALSSECRRAKSSQRHDDDRESELEAKNVRIIELDILNGKLSHRCDLLMGHMSELIRQNQALVAQTLIDKEQYHEKEKRNNLTLVNLNRAKEKLEDKIMDQLRHMDSRRLKKRSGPVNAVKKTFDRVRRAGSELFTRAKDSSSLDKPEEGACALPIDDDNASSKDFFDNFEPDNFDFDDDENDRH